MKEIGTKLGVSRNAVVGRLYRIRRKHPELVLERKPGLNPLGKKRGGYPVTVIRQKSSPKAGTGISGKYAPTQTIGSRRGPASEMTKKELYEMLRRAVENTK